MELILLPSELIHIIIAFMVGFVLGAAYFFGLSETIRFVTRTGKVWLLPVSFVVRMFLLLAGIYLVSGSDWQQIAVCLLGVMLARTFILWLTPLRSKNG